MIEKVAKSKYFDATYYNTRYLNGQVNDPKEAIQHFLDVGIKNDFKPSQHFDPIYYAARYPDAKKANMPAFIHFLLHGQQEGYYPCHLAELALTQWHFDEAFYCEHNKIDTDDPLHHFLAFGLAKHLVISPIYGQALKIFNAYFYRRHYLFDQESVDPWVHFLTEGSHYLFNPHPLFDMRTVKNQMVSKEELNPFFYYLAGGFKTIDEIHPFFDSKYFKEQLSTIDLNIPEHMSPLEFYWNHQANISVSPSAYFDIEHYLGSYADLRAAVNLNPLMHFAMHGYFEGRTPSKGYWEKGVVSSKSHLNFFKAQRNKVNELMKKRVKFLEALEALPEAIPYALVVSNEASLTGAPMVALGIVNELKRLGWPVVSLICKDGPDEKILEKFEAAGPCFTFLNYWNFNKDSRFALDAQFMTNVLKARPPKVAFVNSAGSLRLLSYFNEIGTKVTSIIHEMAHLYQDNFLQDIVDFSDNIVFPAQLVSNAFTSQYRIPEQVSCHVQPQGMLNPHYLSEDKDKAHAELCELLKINHDSFIILGCGTPNSRKGFDLFFQTALETSKRFSKPIHFVWLGQDTTEAYDTSYWVKHDVKKSGLERIFHFLAPTLNTVPFFCGANLFFLSSRADPFPCVVQDAMAGQMPVIMFENATGSAEMFADLDGRIKENVIIEYGNTNAVVETIGRFLEDKILYAEVASASATIVRENHNFSDYVEFLLEIADAKMEGATPDEKSVGGRV